MKKLNLEKMQKNVNIANLNTYNDSSIKFNLKTVYDKFTNSYLYVLPEEEFAELRKEHKAEDFPVGLVLQFYDNDLKSMCYKIIGIDKETDAIVALPTFISPFIF